MLVNTGRLAKLMGAETVIVGMRPETAATMVRMGNLLQEVQGALNLEDGLALLAEQSSKKAG